MAEAFKCDICGALFEERPHMEQDVTWFLSQITDRGYSHSADMCQDCLDNLQLWVKNKGRGENNIIFDLRQQNRELQMQLREAEAKIRMGVINDQGRC